MCAFCFLRSHWHLLQNLPSTYKKPEVLSVIPPLSAQWGWRAAKVPRASGAVVHFNWYIAILPFKYNQKTQHKLLFHYLVFCSRVSVVQIVNTAVNMDTPAAAPHCPAKSPSHCRTVPNTYWRSTVILTATAFMTSNMLSIMLQPQQYKNVLFQFKILGNMFLYGFNMDLLQPIQRILLSLLWGEPCVLI